MESQETTSPPKRRASSTASRVFPEAVGPTMETIFPGIAASPNSEISFNHYKTKLSLWQVPDE
jgi:hypothetical protein